MTEPPTATAPHHGRPGPGFATPAAFRRSVRALVDRHPEVFAPAVWDVPGRVPPGREAVVLLGRAGLLAPAAPAPAPVRQVPPEPDPAPSWQFAAALHEELGLLPAGAVVLTQVEVAAKLLAAFPATAHAARQALAGRSLAALAVTEPGGGLDFDAMTTSVRRGDEGVVVEGEKWLSSNAPFADELLVLARDTAFADSALGRHSLVRVPVDAPGVEVHPLRTLGHRGVTGRIRLTGVRLAPEALLGSPGTGLLTLMRHWVHERVMVALRMTAMAEGLLALLRSAGGPRSGYADRAAAELFVDIAQERASCRRALELLGAGGCPPRTAAGCKLRSADVLRRTAEAALRREAELASTRPRFAGLDPADPGLAERALRDATGLALAGGSDEALLMVIARELR
ncbi:acyl-CoA dehydrogenase family protein [Streptosporangium jomthongense]|uniref:Acyl-CoA dehydrogenase family protein n=1 Tax=Streptosporangium jomthongense TaxID=1193683 RepID=A0ABV8FEJ8_9ACTN